MNNDAHKILVSAIASHGEKIATSNAYCKVYLAGYMVDYPDEKQLLTSLRQLALPDALLAYRCSEISESDVYSFISEVVLKPLESESDFAWGVDAWAAALSIPELMRRNIRQHCFSALSQQLNTDPEPLMRVANKVPQYDGERAIDPSTIESPKKPGNALVSLTAMILLALTTIHFAVGSVAVEKNHTTMVAPLDLPKVVSPSVLPVADKLTNSASMNSIVEETEKVPEQSVVTLKYSGKQDNTLVIKRTGHPLADYRSQAVSIDEGTVKDPYFNLNTALKTQRSQRLKADIEAFLKQAH